MRLKEVENQLKKASNIKGVLGLRKETHGFVIDNINGLKELIPYIEKISVYDDEIETIKSSEIYKTTQDSLSLIQDDAVRLFKIWDRQCLMGC